MDNFHCIPKDRWKTVPHGSPDPIAPDLETPYFSHWEFPLSMPPGDRLLQKQKESAEVPDKPVKAYEFLFPPNIVQNTVHNFPFSFPLLLPVTQNYRAGPSFLQNRDWCPTVSS